MTTVAEVGSARGVRLWRGLGWITWRQHRTALLYAAAPLALAAILMAATASSLHRGELGPALNDVVTSLLVLLLLLPVIAGVFLGAPLLAAEAERRTTQVVWTQTVSRVKWLTAQTVPIAAALAAAGAALGLEYRWWIQPLEPNSWNSWLFALHPLPLAGWLAFGFSLGVLLGGVIRRVVPAMAATAAGYVAVAFLAARWRRYYLPPLHRVLSLAAEYRAAFSFAGSRRPLEIISNRLLGGPLHAVLLTYQPASRFGLFQLIEFGWLIALSAVLIGAAMFLIRRRPA